MERILVSDIMTRDPVTVNSNATLLDCAKTMIKKRVGSVLIVDKKKLLGFIAEKDIIWALIKKTKEDLGRIKAVDIAPRKIETIKPFINIKEAVRRMKKLKFERLPVVQNGELVGIITSKDILGFYPELYTELDEFDKIKEEMNKLKRIKEAKSREPASEGICEECGNQDLLIRVHGMLICESCKNSM